MSDLTEFLSARLAEDEAVARAVPGDGEFCTWNRSWDMSPTRDLVVDGERVAPLPMTMDEHICRWDPARVLAECEVKRAIMGDIETARATARSLPGGTTRLVVMHSLDMIEHHIAAVYAAHPDYRPEWRP